MKYGLIGERLGHSFSKEVHAMLSDYDYELTEIKREDLDGFMRRADFTAINVTIPYKETVIPYLSYISEEAKAIGAVNTIVKRDGKLYGYNTDFFGMTAEINKMHLSLKDKKVVILGTGGTSKTANAVARSLGASEILTVSRTKKDGAIDYDELMSNHLDAEIMINTTPVGMYPDNFSAPIKLDGFTKLEGLIDAIYNPIRTSIVVEAQERGIKAEGGLYMLVAQAVYASEIFLGIKHPIEKLNKIYSKIRRKKENIVLIGMPTSGKSTLSVLIGDELSRKVYDTDSMIVVAEKKSIPSIFAERGEDAFRNCETLAVASASTHNNAVIATGGGVILRKCNMRMLRQNGVIFFIDRPLEKLLPAKDRPLSNDRERLTQLYKERYDIYKASADVIIDADDTPVGTAKKIMGAFYK